MNDRRLWLVVIALALIAGWLGWQVRLLRRERRAVAHWSQFRCELAKTQAIVLVQTHVLQTMREVQSSPAPERYAQNIRSGEIASVLPLPLIACETISPLAGRLRELIGGLMSAGRFDEVLPLLDRLNETPLEAWDSLDLPRPPDLAEQLAGGDPVEEARLRRELEKRGLHTEPSPAPDGGAAELPPSAIPPGPVGEELERP